MWKIYFVDKPMFPRHFLHCLFDIFVPQTIDDGIQHGNYDGVKYRHDHVMIQGIAGSGSHLHKENRAMKNGHSS